MLALTGLTPHTFTPSQSAVSSPTSSPPHSHHALPRPRPHRRPSASSPRVHRLTTKFSRDYLASASSPAAEDEGSSSDVGGDETDTGRQPSRTGDVREEDTQVPKTLPAFLPFGFGSTSQNILMSYRSKLLPTPLPSPNSPALPLDASHQPNISPAPSITRPTSPATSRRPNNTHRALSSSQDALFPKVLELSLLGWTCRLDLRRSSEALLLILPFAGALYKLSHLSGASQEQFFIPCEGAILIAVSVLTIAVSGRRGVVSPLQNSLAQPNGGPNGVAGARPQEARHGRRTSITVTSLIKPELEKDWDIGRLWMTEERDYRDCPDSGVLTALLFGPFLAASLLLSSTVSVSSSTPGPLSSRWLVELPLPSATMSPEDALLRSKRNLFEIATLCSFILSVHLEFSRRADARGKVLPKSEMRRLGRYVALVVGTTGVSVAIKNTSLVIGSQLWREMSMFDIIVASLFYQFCLYVMVRLARRGFTLGELCFVAEAATALFMETVNLTISRIWPLSTQYVKTFRLPTPLLIFQLALIPGCLLAGFLLSPLLVLSRHIAQKPLHRLRNPEEKLRHRRGLAAGVYLGFTLVIVGVIGLWTQWCLGGRSPWLWCIWWLLEGRRPWSRPVLLTYWGILGSLSVAGWNRQLARNRRYRHLHSSSSTTASGSVSDPAGPGVPAATGNEGHLNGVPPSTVTEILDAADKHVPTLGLNARRKFFHALAVLMFLPGILLDPAFTHLAFSAAFALFTFAEYVRYFALYPLGAAVHVFLSEFLDRRDSGTAILSHFYLLTGCAGSLWLEGNSQILEFSGVVVLGVGDALASIVGKRIGRHRWSYASPKSLEGTAAFALSAMSCACALRVFGLVESFSLLKYAVATLASAALEALSMQNDNLVLPLYMWCLLVLSDV